MRILFMGTSDFAVHVLEMLIQSEHTLLAVVTQPDRPAGRRQRLQPPPVKVRAVEAGLTVLQPERASAKSFVAQLRELAPEMICVVAYGQILRPHVLELPSCGCLNVHPSLLPKYRGAAPIQRAIINGESETGATIILLDEGEDTGDLILQRALPIHPLDTAVTLAEKLSALSGELLLEAIALAADGPPPHRPQDYTQATHAPRLTKQESWIDWEESAEQIHNRIRGMQPWPGAVTALPDELILKLHRSLVGNFPGNPDAPAGTVHLSPGCELWVQTGKGGVQLLEVQPANKRPMSAEAFINGYRITNGLRLKPLERVSGQTFNNR